MCPIALRMLIARSFRTDESDSPRGRVHVRVRSTRLAKTAKSAVKSVGDYARSTYSGVTEVVYAMLELLLVK